MKYDKVLLNELTQSDQVGETVPVQFEEPLLFVDVNFGEDNTKRITIMRGDTVVDLARQFSIHNDLDEEQEQSLVELL